MILLLSDILSTLGFDGLGQQILVFSPAFWLIIAWFAMLSGSLGSLWNGLFGGG